MVRFELRYRAYTNFNIIEPNINILTFLICKNCQSKYKYYKINLLYYYDMYFMWSIIKDNIIHDIIK